MKHVIQCNVTLLRDRSVNCLLVCSLYAIAKLAKVELTFKQILDVFSRLYPEGIGRVTYHVSMQMDGVAAEPKKGSIIDFYNNVFVASNNDYLVGIKRNILLLPAESPSRTLRSHAYARRHRDAFDCARECQGSLAAGKHHRGGETDRRQHA